MGEREAEGVDVLRHRVVDGGRLRIVLAEQRVQFAQRARQRAEGTAVPSRADAAFPPPAARASPRSPAARARRRCAGAARSRKDRFRSRPFPLKGKRRPVARKPKRAGRDTPASLLGYLSPLAGRGQCPSAARTSGEGHFRRARCAQALHHPAPLAPLRPTYPGKQGEVRSDRCPGTAWRPAVPRARSVAAAVSIASAACGRAACRTKCRARRRCRRSAGRCVRRRSESVPTCRGKGRVSCGSLCSNGIAASQHRSFPRKRGRERRRA